MERGVTVFEPATVEIPSPEEIIRGQGPLTYHLARLDKVTGLYTSMALCGIGPLLEIVHLPPGCVVCERCVVLQARGELF